MFCRGVFLANFCIFFLAFPRRRLIRARGIVQLGITIIVCDTSEFVDETLQKRAINKFAVYIYFIEFIINSAIAESQLTLIQPNTPIPITAR